VQTGENPSIKLNAGPDYIMKSNDICFYMSISKEENYSLMINNRNNFEDDDDDLTLTEQFTRKISYRKGAITTTKIAGGPKGKQRLSTNLSKNKNKIQQ
jgi:hypothetical protein